MNREMMFRNRLAAWEEEFRTDEHGMAHLAPRCIELLRADIAEFWGEPVPLGPLPESDT